MFRNFLKSSTALAVLATGGLATSATVVNAQQDQDSVGIDQIIVTARKREESLQDIPIALTAFSESDLQEGGLAGLEDISSQAAGFYFYNQGQSQAGRVNSQLRFRGFNATQFSPSFDPGALFIDGVFVLNGGTSISLMDIERVEVIKGPQAAYFGRNTFAGAVNLITKDPNLEEYHGKVDVQADDRGSYDLSALLEGPIVPGKVAASISGRYYDKRGHYVATDGGRLGNEETSAFNAKLLFTPSEDFRVVFRASYSKDEDGAPQGGYIRGNLNDSCSGLTITTPAGEIANPTAYICGIVPDLNSAVPAVPGTNIIDSNTILPDAVAGVIFGEAPADGIPSLDGIGLKRKTKRFSAHATYDVPDLFSLDLVVGYNDQGMNVIRDFDQSALPNTFSNDPQALEDQSIEFRITSEQDGKFRWLVGANYYEQDFTASNAGGNFVLGCFENFTPPEGDCINGGFPFANSFQQSDHTEVLGFFAAADYDFTDQLTLTLEGRYQDDQLTKGVASSAGADSDNALTVNFKKFLPRAILRYIPNETTTLYVSYARGTLPGDVNTEFLNADDRERAQYLAAVDNIGEFTPAEEVTTIELGWKQSMADGRAQLNVAAFYNDWTGIKGRSAATVHETCDNETNGIIGSSTGCQFPGVMVGDQKMIDDPANPGTLIPFLNRRNVLVPGDAEIKGFEVELNAQLMSNWTAGFNVAYQDSKFKDYIFNFVEAISGFSDQRGNRTPRTPKWSANLTSTATFPLGAETNGFVRGDISYLGKQALAETNLAFLDEYYLVNLRAGIETEQFRLELFVKNLTDEDSYAAGARFSDTAFPTNFGNFFIQQGVNVTAQDRRTIGVRASAKF